MNTNDNISDNKSICDDMTTNNALNNENLIVTVGEDNHNKNKSNFSSKNLILKRFLDNNNCVDDCNANAKKSSDRNAINFMVLGYFLLVLILVYAYFGSLISDLFITNTNQINNIYVEKQNQTNNHVKSSTQEPINSDTDVTEKQNKLIKMITSTELIVILWLTLIYGSCLMLFLRFKVLKLERDPNSDKHRKKDSTEELNAFLSNSRNKKNSFKNKNLTLDSPVVTNTNEPFWHK
ncbi:unnamed protein product [Oppiella nova]|uniref:Uncharacterized protein n=1 Tax=Oppiella nova TaxID=334625 RepID=A0A7R9LSM7_9ACAR|nr:unnamed protein product [Oppiella nova]CAG2166504.1 unnamed protein product [Oppiella nova]